MPLPSALAPLASYRQFIIVRTQPKVKNPAKTDKFPISPHDGRVCDAHDPTIWLDHATAEAYATGYGPSYGVGFVLTDRDPFWCLDIDEALNGVGWTGFAQQLCSRLPGCAIEISQSGRGLHVWGAGGLVGDDRRKRRDDLHVELYSELRFIMLGRGQASGQIVAPNPVTTQAVQTLVAEFFPQDQTTVDVPEEGPCPEWLGPTDDADLLRRALQSKGTRSMFGGAATFGDLWQANAEVLAKAYPTTGGDPYDASSADAALAQHLAFWTGRDVARIERLMRQSALARSKWDDHTNYLVGLTIKNACGRQTAVLQDKPVEPVASPSMQAVVASEVSGSPQQSFVTGTTILSASQQQQLFKGCVYIVDEHKVLIPGGERLDVGRFKAMFGGYQFAMDQANGRFVRNAWEAFTESQVLRCPKVNGTCFRPDLPAASIVQDAGRSRVNVYWPIEVPRLKGDATPFLNHLAKLLPDERDRTILLSYLAACVQHVGKKFQWAPLIQGVEGNGKSMLSRCAAHAVGRRYVAWPAADKLGSQFNAWLFGNVLYCVEDIHTPDGNDTIEKLKPMITGEELEIEAKSVDQTTKEICGNFIFNSNHKNGLRKTSNDRRFAVFYCPQQNVTDLTRDGLDGEYMHRMWTWLKQEGGYAIVAELLSTYPIPYAFNPATGCQRAPTTSSTREALANGLGRIEQEIMEQVEQEAVGFAGGWISSMFLDRLLERMGRAGTVPLARRRELLVSIGYDWHPHLTNGRVNNSVMPDNGKPKLFIRTGHAARLMTDPSQIAKAYAEAQRLGQIR